jgi:regulator of RNase E activity RraA/CMP-N-acetylneuraminic acid synthetase
MEKMQVYAFVPAKGTSERIENKNMLFLNGTRLFVRALETLLKCQEIDKVFLDTESCEMYNYVNYLPIEFMKRDSSLANNKTDGHAMFLNEIHQYPDADIYVQLLCTSPFVEPDTIDNALRHLKEDTSYDSALLMKQEKCYFWQNDEPAYNKEHIPNSADLPYTISESMGLYICRKEVALSARRRYGNKPLHLYGKLHELIDVNNREDLIFAETYAKGVKQNEVEKLNLLKHFITSAALSDILDDIEAEKGEKCGGVISGLESNFTSVLFGRANTLRLRTLQEGENYEGIYDALSSYEGIADNDIIVVENEQNANAYFGDLNARLAIRHGAAGAIIDGATRDKSATINLHFPVFARGYNSQDVRRRATTDYINKPVKVGGITVHPKDLIFADDGGVVVIHQKHEQEILDRVLKTFHVEKAIVQDILRGTNINNILENNGAF